MLISVGVYLALAAVTFTILFLAWRGVLAYFRFRGVRLVSCPETAESAAVEVNARHAALTRGLGHVDLQLKSCSRWPERQGCGQECLRQIEAAPEDCLVRTILTRSYQGKSCVYCRKPLEEMDWLEHRPALMRPDAVTFEWKDIPPETIPEVLLTYAPVCWNCHVATSFRRRYPDLVIDRKGREPTKPVRHKTAFSAGAQN
jgi:hypothetical protein